jgi:hypothetical protein
METSHLAPVTAPSERTAPPPSPLLPPPSSPVVPPSFVAVVCGSASPNEPQASEAIAATTVAATPDLTASLQPVRSS